MQLVESNNIKEQDKVSDNITINIQHKNWNDKCLINTKTKLLYRESNNDETGNFELDGNKLIIYWKKWDFEIFINNDNIYYYQDNELFIYHTNWNEYCTINNKNIWRKSHKDDIGTYELSNNKLIIYWEKWNTEIFYKFDNLYYFEKFILFTDFDQEQPCTGDEVSCCRVGLRKKSECNGVQDTKSKYIINTFLNKIYNIDNLSEYSDIDIDNITLWIKILNPLFNSARENMMKDSNQIEDGPCKIDTLEKYYFKYIENNRIILYKNIFKELIIVKDFEQSVIINLLNNEIKTVEKVGKKGIYNFTLTQETKVKGVLLNIYWDDSVICEVYKEPCIDDEVIQWMTGNNPSRTNKYYYNDYLESSKEIIFINNINEINDTSDINYDNPYKINYFNNYLYNNDNNIIKFIENNNIYYIFSDNILKKYHLIPGSDWKEIHNKKYYMLIYEKVMDMIK